MLAAGANGATAAAGTGTATAYECVYYYTNKCV